MSNKYLRLLLPHIIAFATLMIVAFAYYSPALSGKVLSQGDNLQGAGMQHEIQDYIAKGDPAPLWTNAAFGGMPSYQISMRNYTNLIQPVKTASLLFGGISDPHLTTLLVMLGFYLLLIAMKIDWRIAIIGALGYGLSSNYVILQEAGHSVKIVTMAYMAPTLAGMLLAWRGKYWLGGGITALFFSLQLFSNHLQITYYFALLAAIVAIGLGINALINNQLAQFLKGTAIIAAVSLLAVVTVLPRLATTYEYTKETIRGGSDLKGKNGAPAEAGLDKDYAFGWSYGIGESFTLLVPNFKGGSSSDNFAQDQSSNSLAALQQIGSQNQQLAQQLSQFCGHYWGEQPFTSGPVYFGAVICLLFVLGLALSRDRVKWALLIATSLLIMIAWGKNLPGINYFLFDHFPLFNKFRAVSMAMGIAQLSFSIIAMLGLQAIFDNTIDDKKKLQAVYIAGGTTLGILVMLYGLGGGDFGYANMIAQLGQSLGKNAAEGQAIMEQLRPQLDGLGQALRADRAPLLAADILRSMVFVAIATGMLWAMAKRMVDWRIALSAFGLLVVCDLWIVDKRFVNDTNFTEPTEKAKISESRPVDAQIKQDKDLHYRVVDFSRGNPFQSAMLSFNHKSMGGYHPAKLGLIQNMIEKYLSKPNEYMAVYGLFNTKYVIGPKDQLQPIKNMGNAWFVREVQIVDSPDAELDSIGRLDAARKAVVRKDNAAYLQGLTIQYDTANTIKLTAYHPEKLTYKSDAKTEQFALFSEVYYPSAKGWNVYIDNKLVPNGFIQTDYALRGLRVPAGQHTVEMRFEPQSYYGTTLWATLASFVVVALFLAGLFFYFKQNNGDDSDAPSFVNINPPAPEAAPKTPLAPTVSQIEKPTAPTSKATKKR